jgi:hypothetical protein
MMISCAVFGRDAIEALATGPLPFKGRARVGMGGKCATNGIEPIPIPAFPLKGKEQVVRLE